MTLGEPLSLSWSPFLQLWNEKLSLTGLRFPNSQSFSPPTGQHKGSASISVWLANWDLVKDQHLLRASTVCKLAENNCISSSLGSLLVLTASCDLQVSNPCYKVLTKVNLAQDYTLQVQTGSLMSKVIHDDIQAYVRNSFNDRIQSISSGNESL